MRNLLITHMLLLLPITGNSLYFSDPTIKQILAQKPALRGPCRCFKENHIHYISKYDLWRFSTTKRKTKKDLPAMLKDSIYLHSSFIRRIKCRNIIATRSTHSITSGIHFWLVKISNIKRGELLQAGCIPYYKSHPSRRLLSSGTPLGQAEDTYAINTLDNTIHCFGQPAQKSGIDIYGNSNFIFELNMNKKYFSIHTPDGKKTEKINLPGDRYAFAIIHKTLSKPLIVDYLGELLQPRDSPKLRDLALIQCAMNLGKKLTIPPSNRYYTEQINESNIKRIMNYKY